MQVRRLFSLALLSLGTFTFLSCSEDNDPTPSVPTTYEFENVDYSGQTQRIQMLDSLVNKAKAANDGQAKITKAELQAIYENQSGDLFGTDKDLRSKTNAEDVDFFLNQFAQVETYSGTADHIKGGRLITPEGVEPAQLIAKGLMGAVLYYQATSHYLGAGQMNVDNTEVVEGKGTAMQHHWDEAFGYFAAPENYLSLSKEEAEESSKYWAKYAVEMSTAVDLRDAIFTAFIEGRAAIGRNDMETRDAAIETIRTNWDKLVAACAVHYINSSLNDLAAGNMDALYHHWSEGKGFAFSLKHNTAAKISPEEYVQLMDFLGETPSGLTATKLQEANSLLQRVYGFSNAEMLNL